jgi:hypothetical protein
MPLVVFPAIIYHPFPKICEPYPGILYRTVVSARKVFFPTKQSAGRFRLAFASKQEIASQKPLAMTHSFEDVQQESSITLARC